MHFHWKSESAKRIAIAILMAAICGSSISSCAIPGLNSSNTSASSETTEPIYTTIDYSEYVATSEESDSVETDVTEETEEYIEYSQEDMALLFAKDIAGDLLGREIADDEVLTSSLLIAHGELQIEEFIKSIVTSDEFMGLNLSDDEYIFRLSLAMLNDTLSSSRNDFLLAQLEAGAGRENIISMLINCEQFISTCYSFGLNPGNTNTAINEISELYDIVAGVPEGEFISTTRGYLPSDAVINEINDALASLDEHYSSCGFMLVDINTGRGIAYNVSRRYYSASSIKGPYAASLCCLNPDVIENYESTFQNMLVFSDNDAFTRLFNTFRRTYIDQWAAEAGVEPECIQYKYPRICTRDLFRLWIRNYEFFTTDPNGEICASWMREPEYSLIHSEFEGLYVTESKAGWMVDDNPQHTTTIDAGIVHADSGTYIVVIESNVPRDIEPLRPLLQALNHAHDEMTAIG